MAPVTKEASYRYNFHKATKEVTDGSSWNKITTESYTGGGGGNSASV